MLYALINGYATPKCKNQDGNNKTPEIYFLAMTKREMFVRGFPDCLMPCNNKIWLPVSTRE